MINMSTMIEVEDQIAQRLRVVALEKGCDISDIANRMLDQQLGEAEDIGQKINGALADPRLYNELVTKPEKCFEEGRGIPSEEVKKQMTEFVRAYRIEQS